jgi:acetylornithine deacetylase/succinyl-diaminopimelate desuccinylase-like protein
MNNLETKLLAAIAPQRLKQLTLDLTAIPSPTGQARSVAEAYARHLSSISMDVDITYERPQSPNVVARRRGAGSGPTLQLAGHLDTIPVPHAPPYFADGFIYGRGAADMKGGLAAMAEAARVLSDAGIRLKGDLLLTAYDLHEAPGGHGEGLSELIKRGVYGDAAIVCEAGSRDLPIAGKGMGIFEITVQRSGETLHELYATPDTANPIYIAALLIARLQERAAELARVMLPDVGAESIFVGMLHSGDFYNRVPLRATVTGTRRHGPDKTFADVRRELEKMIAEVQTEDTTGTITIDLTFTPIRESFRIDPAEPIVGIVRQAYADMNGEEIPLVGMSMVADASILIREAHIPTVYHGPWTDRAHADIEYIALSELVKATQMYILCALRFCGVA